VNDSPVKKIEMNSGGEFEIDEADLLNCAEDDEIDQFSNNSSQGSNKIGNKHKNS